MVALAGHAGGPAIQGDADENVLADAVERALDEAGWETAHVVGNSLGGYVALQLATRGRARSVVALAPSDLLNRLGRVAGLLEAVSQLPTDEGPARALTAGLIADGLAAVDAWNEWHRARTPAA